MTAREFHTKITKRLMKRKHRDGRVTEVERYVLNYTDPKDKKRAQRFFERRKDAEAAMNELHTKIVHGQPLSSKKVPTVAEATEHWLRHCDGRVTPFTLTAYKQSARTYIIGPVLIGTAQERGQYTRTGQAPENAKWEKMLGDFKVSDLTTAQIREWHQIVLRLSTPYVARNAKKHLSTILSLVGEDFGVRVPPMPRRVASGYRKKERALLRQDQVKTILEAAKLDKRHGIYYAFPFLTGVRPGELLGLLWEDVDFVDNVIHIHRNQDLNGGIKPFPKTEAGQRTIPMVPMLREMLLEWQPRCPTRTGYPHRVFPALGYQTKGEDAWVRAGGPMIIQNYRNRIWVPMLKRLGLPHVTPYAARHLVISNLQAEGVEVGRVAKIAGHANPRVTLQHYTHSVRDSAGVMDKLNHAYGLQ